MEEVVERVLQQHFPSSPIWEVKRVHGSILSLDIGSNASGLSPCCLTIYMSDWVLCHNDQVILDCMDIDGSLYNEALVDLCGKRIVKIEKTEGQHEIKICIDEGYCFILKANLDFYEVSDELFFLIQDGKPSISYRVDRGFSFETQ